MCGREREYKFWCCVESQVDGIHYDEDEASTIAKCPCGEVSNKETSETSYDDAHVDDKDTNNNIVNDA